MRVTWRVHLQQLTLLHQNQEHQQQTTHARAARGASAPGSSARSRFERTTANWNSIPSGTVMLVGTTVRAASQETDVHHARLGGAYSCQASAGTAPPGTADGEDPAPADDPPPPALRPLFGAALALEEWGHVVADGVTRATVH